jgi:hypothetical protein
MVRRLLRAIIVPLLLLCLAIPVRAVDSASLLDQRLQTWPDWRLPAPLPRPDRRGDLLYPAWFAGEWQVTSLDLTAEGETGEPLRHQARFLIDAKQRVVADRAFNALAIGNAVLGSALLTVEQPADDHNRQLARLQNDQLLETTVIGRRQSDPQQEPFTTDELVLQIVHGPGAPRISRVETLSRYHPCPSTRQDSAEGGAAQPSTVERICADQWQARFSGPEQGLDAAPLAHAHYRLALTRLPDQPETVGSPNDPARRTGAATGGDH